VVSAAARPGSAASAHAAASTAVTQGERRRLAAFDSAPLRSMLADIAAAAPRGQVSFWPCAGLPTTGPAAWATVLGAERAKRCLLTPRLAIFPGLSATPDSEGRPIVTGVSRLGVTRESPYAAKPASDTCDHPKNISYFMFLCPTTQLGMDSRPVPVLPRFRLAERPFLTGGLFLLRWLGLAGSVSPTPPIKSLFGWQPPRGGTARRFGFNGPVTAGTPRTPASAKRAGDTPRVPIAPVRRTPWLESVVEADACATFPDPRAVPVGGLWRRGGPQRGPYRLLQ
jgi:hypothetical protein